MKIRTPQALAVSRAISCTPPVLDRWFSEFSQLLLKHEILDKPSAIWNCDESGFPLCPKSGKVMVSKGTKQVYQITGNNRANYHSVDG